MSLSKTCDAIASINNETTYAELTELAAKCEAHLSNVGEIIDAVENSLSTSADAQRMSLWVLVDRLAKQHAIFLDALRPKVIPLAAHHAPATTSPEWGDFEMLLKSSFTVLFGTPLVSLILLQLKGEQAGTPAESSTRDRSSKALTLHTTALRSAGAFMTKRVAVERPAAHKHALQVKTIDSQMAMNVASSYAPAKPVELLVPELHADADAPKGYMKALPADYTKNFEETRRKRLREIIQKDREEQDRRQEQALLNKVRSQVNEEESREEQTGAATQPAVVDDFADIQMPLELPRDEFGVKRGNFPLGVRFIRDAVRACGGAVELDVLVSRLSTLASREAVREFGDLREFLHIHSPTFRLAVEKNKWIVRLTEQGDLEDATWESMSCPSCSKVVRGRNFARHLNSRSCITAQIALGLQGDYEDRGAIAELAFMAKQIISKRDTYDDGDVDAFADCLRRAAEVRRFKLASQRQFAPILKALRAVRDRWLRIRGAEEVDEVVVTSADASTVNLFRTLGRSVHRLPIAWVEMGDVIDMCHRFTDKTLPPLNPPPRPADPRISLHNEYPGFLLCESEVDDEDEPSGDEDEFSDDEAPAFTFAPPVDTAESLFTAGFPRDTKRLQHRMRTAPPLVLQRVLKGDRTQTQREMYADMQNSGARVALGAGSSRAV